MRSAMTSRGNVTAALAGVSSARREVSYFRIEISRSAALVGRSWSGARIYRGAKGERVGGIFGRVAIAGPWDIDPASVMAEEELDLFDETNEENEEIMTPAQLIHKLEEAWLNEKFSPDLLENKSEIVECVMEQLDHMEQNLQRAKKGDLKVTIHRMEIERIRYILSSYLRSRLQKIEKFFPHILEKEKSRLEADPSYLSPQEFAFAKEYTANCETHLKNLALKHMPSNLQVLDLIKAVSKPNVDSFVFLRVKEKQENILVEPEAEDQREYTVDLEEGSQHLMRYRTIAPLVANGAVQLI